MTDRPDTPHPDQGPPEDDLLAAEYAIGLLDAEDYRLARARMAGDPGFAARVIGWQAQLARMADLPPLAPPAAARAALLTRLFPTPARTSWWRSPGFWPGLASGVFGSALLALVTLAVIRPDAAPQTAPRLHSAEIVSAAQDFRVVALVDKDRDEVTLTRTAGAAPAGRILQVWAHGPEEPAQSVGLWPEGDTVRLTLPPDIAAVDGVLTLGVSEEPPGGSPTGRPSGRVYGTVDIAGVRPLR